MINRQQLSLKSAGGVDADAQLLIDAASLTDETQISAWDTFVKGCKSAGVWDNIVAVYPIIGGTASKHKWNGKNPVDTDAGFRLSFTGTTYHNANGMWFGNNRYAETHCSPAVDLASPNTFIAWYMESYTNNKQMFGMRGDNNNLLNIVNTGSGALQTNMSSSSGDSFPGTVDTDTNDHKGAHLVSGGAGSNNQTKARNGYAIYTNKGVSATPTGDYGIVIGGKNDKGSINSLGITNKFRMVIIGLHVTDTEGADLTQLMEDFQLTLGRSTI
jgi:hypothetical protein